MEQVKRIGYLDYLIVFEAYRTPLSDFYVKNEPHLQILGAYDATQRAGGLLLCRFSGTLLEILCVKGEKEGQDLERQLMEAAIEIGRDSSMEKILLRVPQNNGKEEAFGSLVEELGFEMTGKETVFRSLKQDYGRWQKYMEQHGNKILRYLEKEGFRFLSFAEAPDKVLQKVRESRKRGFDPILEPNRILNGEKGRFCDKISYLSLKGEEVAAYCLVTQPSKLYYVFEIISAAAPYQNTGVIFQPFALSVKEVGNYPYQAVGFAMDQKNDRAIALSRRMMKSLVSVQNQEYHYEKILERKDK